MFRTSVRLVAALIVAVGLLVAPATGLSKSKPRKETKVSKNSKKKKESPRDKKSQKRDDRASKRKASSKSSNKTASRRRGKNDDAESRATRRRREQPRPVVARNVADDEPDEADEPAGPRPANRLVADIAPTRVVQIQSALIQKGLLAGPPSGVYDQATFQAMAGFQSRNGWNANGNPTADALKALGVPKNSGRSLYTPARVVEATAPPQ
jgi:hypothetical protein